MSVKVSIHTLYFPNLSSDFVDAHKSVMNHFNIPVNYTVAAVRPGVWMDQIIRNSEADIVGFIDIDCIPLNDKVINEAIKFVAKNKSICGVAQATNHIPPMTHVFCSPAFFFMWRPLHTALNQPSFLETQRSDVGQEICYVAETNGVRMKQFYPTHFEREPQEGVWRLGNYGLYGIGTVFENKIYHLYQSRMQSNVELFIKRCKEVVSGTFTTDGMHSSTNFDFPGRICRFEPEAALSKNIEGKY